MGNHTEAEEMGTSCRENALMRHGQMKDRRGPSVAPSTSLGISPAGSTPARQLNFHSRSLDKLVRGRSG
jgi:hypothetical protein